MKKIGILLLALSAAVTLPVGVFSHSLALVGDGVCTASVLAALLLAKKRRAPRAVAGVLVLVAGAVTAFAAFFALTRNVGYYELAPQLWSLPFMIAVIIARLYAAMDARDPDAKKRARLCVVSAILALAAVFASVPVYHADPAVGLALAVSAALVGARLLPRFAHKPKPEKAKKAKKSKKAQGGEDGEPSEAPEAAETTDAQPAEPAHGAAVDVHAAPIAAGALTEDELRAELQKGIDSDVTYTPEQVDAMFEDQ